MKKALLSTSAIALAGVMASPATAAEWDVRVGGFYNAMVAYTNADGNFVTGSDFDGVDVQTNTEIYFLPSITLDNGIKFGAVLQLEGETRGDQFDESYIFVDGSFGRVLIGSENSAGYLMTYAAPNAMIISMNSPSTVSYVPWFGAAAAGAPTPGVGGETSVFLGTLGTTFIEVGAGKAAVGRPSGQDPKRLTYFTPRFAGFQLGVSYARDNDEDNFFPTNIGAGSGNLSNMFDIGVNYVQTFGDFNVAASARWGIGQDNTAGYTNDNPTVLGFGLNLGYGGFTIGGSWVESNETNNGVDDGVAYDVGVAYATGPWTFSMTYFRGENGEPAGGTCAAGCVDEQDTFGVAANYQLAKGVRLNVFGSYVDFDSGFGPANDVDGWILGTGVGLSF